MAPPRSKPRTSIDDTPSAMSRPDGRVPAVCDPLTSRVPLKVVLSEIRSISAVSCVYSVFRLVRSVEDSWPEPACTARLFMRVMMSKTLDMAPSAICSIELAWPALTAACFRPDTSRARREPTARAAASSFADSTRVPADSLARELVAAMSDAMRLRCATFAA